MVYSVSGVRNSLLIFLLIVLSPMIFAQPNYGERTQFFSQDSTQQAIAFNVVATDGSINEEEYILGAGDGFLVSISGLQENNTISRIDYEGKLYIPGIGGVVLKDLSLRDGKKRIDSLVNRFFRNVSVFISLVEIKKIKVSLHGKVVKPGSFSVFANTRLSDLVSISAGLQKSADIRNVRITGKRGDNRFYDLLSFLRKGSLQSNPYLKEGDFVYFDVIDKLVTIAGAVKYPADYELIEGEDASHLIDVAGGYLAKAKPDTIELVRFVSDKIQQSYYFTKAQIDNGDVNLQNRDIIIVREYSEYLKENIVEIRGMVQSPGIYKIIDNKTTLTEIISEAGGFTEKASLTDAKLYRFEGIDGTDLEYDRLKLIPRADMTDEEYSYFKTASRQRRGAVVADFVSLFGGGEGIEDIVLKRNDVITIPEKKNYIVLSGQVMNPGLIEYNQSYIVEDYIRLAGGFGWRALEGDIMVIRANSGEWIEPEDVDVLRPGDTIWVPEDPPGPKFWDVFQSTLMILGQVATVVAATVAVIVSTK